MILERIENFSNKYFIFPQMIIKPSIFIYKLFYPIIRFYRERRERKEFFKLCDEMHNKSDNNIFHNNNVIVPEELIDGINNKIYDNIRR